MAASWVKASGTFTRRLVPRVFRSLVRVANPNFAEVGSSHALLTARLSGGQLRNSGRGGQDFVTALISAFFGFSGIAAAQAGIAKLLFLLFLVLFIVSLITGRRAPV
jgi:uncharacterized membrane protein YtjA (UPF0391 family)